MGPHVGVESSSGGVRQTVAAARAQLDDLLAELEAGARFVDGIERGIAALDKRVSDNYRNREEMEHLVGRLGDLRASVSEQRVLMKQLRECFDTLRRQIGSRP